MKIYKILFLLALCASPLVATELYFAASKGDLLAVQQLIAQGKNVNEPYSYGTGWYPEDRESWAPIHGAIRSGKLEVVNALIGAGADVNITGGGNGGFDAGYQPPLFTAIEMVSNDLYKGLINLECLSESLHIIKKLIKSGAYKGYSEALKQLMMQGPTDLRYGYNPPLSPDQRIAQRALFKATVDYRSKVTDNGGDQDALSQLLIATGTIHTDFDVDMLSMAIDAGADVNFKTQISWYNPPHASTPLELIIDRIFSCLDNTRETANLLAIAKLFVAKGADLSVKNYQGKTPYEQAKRTSYWGKQAPDELVEILKP